MPPPFNSTPPTLDPWAAASAVPRPVVKCPLKDLLCGRDARVARDRESNPSAPRDPGDECFIPAETVLRRISTGRTSGSEH
jgi:hypothetical protein